MRDLAAPEIRPLSCSISCQDILGSFFSFILLFFYIWPSKQTNTKQHHIAGQARGEWLSDALAGTLCSHTGETCFLLSIHTSVFSPPEIKSAFNFSRLLLPPLEIVKDFNMYVFAVRLSSSHCVPTQSFQAPDPQMYTVPEREREMQRQWQRKKNCRICFRLTETPTGCRMG